MRPLPFDLVDLQAFVAIVDLGSLTRAAEMLRSSKSVLSRRIASLEYALGMQLLFRDRRGARPTEAGTGLYRTAADVLAQLEQLHDEATAAQSEIEGPLMITAPLSFGTTHLAPALAQFANLHPKVSLDVRLDDQVVDLLEGGFDLAVRVGLAPDPALGARRLASVHLHLLASPGYIVQHGRLEKPEDLCGHRVLEYTNEGLQIWQKSFGKAVDPASLDVRFRSDSGDMLRNAAVAGLGLVILPDFLVEQAVSSGDLEPLLPGYPLAQAEIYAVSAPGRPKLRRVRALIEHLTKTFGPEPPWAIKPES